MKPVVDRTTKFLLAAIALLLCALLVRPLLTPPSAQAQASAPAPQTETMMAADNGTVYILQNGKLSVYMVDTALTRNLFGGLTREVLKDSKLLRVLSQDLSNPQDLNKLQPNQE